MSARRRRQGPGRRIGGGRLRVDARRAVAKLRDYQLPEPTLWCLEVVRAAIARGASEIEARGDADDLWIAWRGAPPEPALLTEILDELVSPAPAVERRWMRLLATGVNTVLGTRPRWVDLYVRRDGETHRVRYTPRMLDAPKDDDDESPLDTLAAIAAPTPQQLPWEGVAVHVRRFPGFETLGRFLGGKEPPELPLLRQTCDDMRVPLRVGGALLERTRSPRDLLRYSVEGVGEEVFVAVLEPATLRRTDPAPRADLAELGAVLASPVWALPDAPEDWRAPVPLRLFADVDRLPTNASRSEVRTDESPVREVLERATEALPTLVETLAAELGDDPTHDWDPPVRERLRAAAIQLVASVTAGSDWPTHLGRVPKWMEPLLELPLLRDAVGHPRDLRYFLPPRAFVHRGREPIPEVYERFFDAVLWVPPGDPSGALLGEWEAPDSKAELAVAEERLQAWKKWMQHPPRAPRVPEEKGQWISVRFGPDTKLPKGCVDVDHFALDTLEGELVLLDPKSVGRRRRGTGEVTMLKEGRPLGHAVVEFPIPFEAVLEVPGLQPAFDYASAVRDTSFETATRAPLGAAIVAAEALATLVMRPERDLPKALTRRGVLVPDELKRALRLSMRRVASALGASAGGAQVRNRLNGPLTNVPIWPSVDGKGRKDLSFRELYRATKKEPMILVPPETETLALADRFGVAADSEDRESLAHLLPEVDVYPYDPSRARPRVEVAGHLAKRIALPGAVTLLVDEEDRRGAIAWGTIAPALYTYHGGIQLRREEYEPAFAPCTIACDDDGVLPTPHWDDVALVTKKRRSHRDWELQLVHAVIDAMSGEDVPALLFEGDLRSSKHVHETLLHAAARPGARAGIGRARMDRLAAMLLVPRWNAEPTSIDALKEHALVEWLEPVEAQTMPEVGDEWHPVVCDRAMATTLGKLTRKTVRHAGLELERRRKVALRAARLRAHQDQPERAMPEPGPRSVALQGAQWRGVVALADATQGSALVIDARIDQRPFKEISQENEVPLHAVLELDRNLADETFESIPKDEVKRIVRSVKNAARRLLLKIASDAPESLVDDPTTASLFFRWTRENTNRKQSSVRKTFARLREAPIWRTVQGERASLDEASTQTRIRVARWDGEWLAPADGEKRSGLDRAILALPPPPKDHARKKLLENLARPKQVLDRSKAVKTLQTERRVDRGLVPTPRLSSIAAERRASLVELVRDRRRSRLLGPGEIAWAEGRSGLDLYSGGELVVGMLPLEIRPAIRVAMESPTLAARVEGGALDAQTSQQLHGQLRPIVAKLFAAFRERAGEPSDALRLALREGLLRDVWLEQDEVAGVELFQTTTDDWVALADLDAQQQRFGDVWYTTSTSYLERTRRPLDDRRLAVRLDPEEVPAFGDLVTAVDAADELKLDDEARRNMSRPKATSLALPSNLRPRDYVARTELHGKRGSGWVGVLTHAGRTHARVHLHREMRPLGSVRLPKDEWPIVAVLEHPKLKPNRTWSGPVETPALKRLVTKVRDAAEEILQRAIEEPPADAVITHEVTRLVSKTTLGDAGSVRGWLWLEESIAPGSVEVHLGERTMVPPRSMPKGGGPYRPLPLRGTLLAAMTDSHPAHRVQGVLRDAYVAMLDVLVGDDSPWALAHLIYALRIDLWEPSKLALRRQLPCVYPAAVPLRVVKKWLDAKETVEIREPEDLRQGARCVIDDGSPAANAVIEALGPRGKRWSPAPMVTERAIEAVAAAEREPVEEAPKQSSSRKVRSKPSEGRQKAKAEQRRRERAKERAKERARKKHPLDPLAYHLRALISATGSPPELKRVLVVPRRKKGLLTFDDARGILELSGAHPQLVALQAARTTRSADAERGMRLLVAHAFGVMNRALSSVTDAHERAAIAELLRD